MTSDISQGAKANKNGKIGENILIPLFKENGYTVISNSEYEADKKLIKDHYQNLRLNVKEKGYKDLDKLVLRNYPYTSIYGNKNSRTEFLIINRPKNRKVRVEVKWQQSSGSVDEKFPYVWLNCVFSFPEKEVIVIIDGGGFKQSARDWIVKQAQDRWLIDDDEKQISIMTISEFITFFNRELA